MEKKDIFKAAVGNLRKELRAHGGKRLLPAEQKPVDAEPADEEVVDEAEAARKPKR